MPMTKTVLTPGAPYPLGELRSRLDELPRDQAIGVICRSGQRAYYATRILLQHGFDARTVADGNVVPYAVCGEELRDDLPVPTGDAGTGKSRAHRAVVL